MVNTIDVAGEINVGFFNHGVHRGRHRGTQRKKAELSFLFLGTGDPP